MRKSAKLIYAACTAIAVVAVAVLGLSLMIIKSTSISFVGRQEQITFHLLAYAQLGLLAAWMVIRNDSISKNLIKMSRRDHWLAAIAVVITPFIFANAIAMLFPLIAYHIGGEAATKEFTYVATEPYARTSRKLVKLNLVDDKGGDHWVVFQKDRAARLALKCGDIIKTKGSSSFLGYVINSETKVGGIMKQCPRR